jgi:DNA-binding response OmpR family regulator
MECRHHFAAEDAGSDDWYDYFPTENWDAAILGDGTLGAGEQGLRTVLIVDDTEDNLDLLEDLLDDHSVKIIRASSGPEAIQAAKRGRLDLVILDVNMPEMDGFEAARRLRQTEFGADVPIIFLTAYRTSDRVLVTGLGAGANDYVTKPFAKDDLLARVEVLLRRGSTSHR